MESSDNVGWTIIKPKWLIIKVLKEDCSTEKEKRQIRHRQYFTYIKLSKILKSDNDEAQTKYGKTRIHKYGLLAYKLV